MSAIKVYSVYSVKNGYRGKEIEVVSNSKERAIEVADIREMGKTTAQIIDPTPKFRQCFSGIGEPMDDIEWYDPVLEIWTSNMKVDTALYVDAETEIL